ncbi:MAG: cation diffusion facilitator family transporter [Verrucomicrobia bacterium]|nr:cation diffusion facilitator family transporter [Verrucomicrobiota bacterium]
MSAHATGQRFALQGMFVNLALAFIKISAGLLGHAYALIADGVESLLDIGSSLVIWSGLKFAAKPPDEEHPYGHGKAEPIAALVVALVVLSTATGLAIQSVREIQAPLQAAPKPFTLVVLVGVVLVKEFLFRRVVQLGDEVGSTALKTEAWHHRSDAITSVAAFIGISIALVGGKGYEVADKIAALIACAVIATNGVLLLIPAFLEIMDTAPAKNVSRAIRETARTVHGVREIDKCHVRKMGLEYYVDIHVLVDGNLSVREGHEIAHDVKDRLRAEHPAVRDVLVHIEPA